jgi:hypothetical protein
VELALQNGVRFARLLTNEGLNDAFTFDCPACVDV